MTTGRTNPWDLSDREMACCDGLVETGCIKSITKLIPELSVRTIETYLYRARSKAGIRNFVLLAVEHDRIQRGVR